MQVFTDVTGSPCFPFTMFNPGFLAKIIIIITTTTTTGPGVLSNAQFTQQARMSTRRHTVTAPNSS